MCCKELGRRIKVFGLLIRACSKVEKVSVVLGTFLLNGVQKETEKKWGGFRPKKTEDVRRNVVLPPPTHTYRTYHTEEYGSKKY